MFSVVVIGGGDTVFTQYRVFTHPGKPEKFRD